ncbi:MAG: hypothetical protein K0S76_1127 [Herbinix sp.]|jgi:uncharacterized beta-barrel protein YwiB (DUF1934 family)|nr:hypothetical protein [Herbinix sp.]
MKREVTVTIDGLQADDEGEAVSITVPGIYHFRDNKHYIHYEENAVHGEETTKNLIKITEDRVELTKTGRNSTQMLFHRKEATETVYHTPYGTLLLEIRTSELTITKMQDEIRVKLLYTLWADGSRLSDNQVSIRICSRM